MVKSGTQVIAVSTALSAAILFSASSLLPKSSWAGLARAQVEQSVHELSSALLMPTKTAADRSAKATELAAKKNKWISLSNDACDRGWTELFTTLIDNEADANREAGNFHPFGGNPVADRAFSSRNSEMDLYNHLKDTSLRRKTVLQIITWDVVYLYAKGSPTGGALTFSDFSDDLSGFLGNSPQAPLHEPCDHIWADTLKVQALKEPFHIR
jgi:hypothetical protein